MVLDGGDKLLVAVGAGDDGFPGKLLMGVVGTNPVYERYMLTSDR
jgi:hypothetical protein